MTGVAPPQRGKRLPFCAPAKSARFEPGLAARFPAMYMPRCGVRKKGLGSWFYRLDRSRFPAGGIGSCFACRQSRRASKPGKRRAQRAECQKAGLRPAFSRRARRRCGVRRRGLGPWFYRLDGNRSLQREAAPVSRTGKVGALQNQASGAHNAPNLGKGLGQAPQGASGSRFLPHSALRSTSSPSGPCATCWKPAFSYRRTGPA